MAVVAQPETICALTRAEESLAVMMQTAQR